MKLDNEKRYMSLQKSQKLKEENKELQKSEKQKLESKKSNEENKKLQEAAHEKFMRNDLGKSKDTSINHAQKNVEIEQYLKEISGSTSPIVESKKHLEAQRAKARAAKKGIKITYDDHANVKEMIEKEEKEEAFKALPASAVDSIFD